MNATRGGSEGPDIEVYDPRTGEPLKFTYEPRPTIRRTPIRAHAADAGAGRRHRPRAIYKTYKDPRTYMMNGDDIVWVRSLSGYRLGVLLPKGFAFISSNVAAQLSTTADGRLKLAFANPSGQTNPVTIHARKTTAMFTPIAFTDMFFDDIKTLYDLACRRRHDRRGADLQRLSQGRQGDARHAGLPAAEGSEGLDLDTAKALHAGEGRRNGTVVKLDVPIMNDKQSAHLRITGTLMTAATRSSTASSCSSGRCTGCATRCCCPRAGTSRRLAVGDDRHGLERPRVRRAHQPERREQLQSDDSRAEGELRWGDGAKGATSGSGARGAGANGC